MNRDKILNNKNPPNGFKDQLINAGMQSGLAFFTTLSSISLVVARADPANALIASCISAGLTFFTSLCVQRGLQKKE